MLCTNGMLKLILMMNLFLHAEVNVKDASFFKSWTDEVLRRTYKSRSVYKSLFGLGWCTDFEKKLRISDEEVVLEDCTLGIDLVFKRKEKVFVEITNNNDKLTKVAGSYWRLVETGGFQKFDEKGRLLRAQDHRGRSFDIKYNETSIKEVLIDKSYRLTVDSKNGKVARLKGPRMVDFLYLINDKGLIEVQKSQKLLQKYDYDDYGNMSYLRENLKEERITYDAKKDWITSRKTSDGCTEKYTYSEPAPLQAVTVRSLDCPGQKTSYHKYQFYYAKREDGKIYLQEIKMELPNKVISQKYDSKTGEVIANSERIIPRLATQTDSEPL